MKTGNHPNMTENMLIATELKHQNKQPKFSQSIVRAGAILKGSTCLLKNGFSVIMGYALLKTLRKK